MLKKIISFTLILCLCLLSLTACGISPSECTEHKGEEICEKCGLNYFHELTNIIQSKASDETNTIEADTENIDCRIEFDSEENSVFISLVYKDIKELPVVFLMTMKSSTGSIYGWALSYDEKMVGGTFDANQVSDIGYKPNIKYNDLSAEVFDELDVVYNESISLCVDMLYSLMEDNTNHLTIKDFGFTNYTPSVK